MAAEPVREGCSGCALAAPPPAAARRTIAVVGPPNSGKSTLFNRLTGLRQKVANYPGVTVEKREGRLAFPGAPEVQEVTSQSDGLVFRARAAVVEGDDGVVFQVHETQFPLPLNLDEAEEILDGFPNLVADDILAVLAFAAQRERRLFAIS